MSPEEPDDELTPSSHPKDWPGIPGRGDQRQAGEAQVTRAQRKLEEEVPHADEREEEEDEDDED